MKFLLTGPPTILIKYKLIQVFCSGHAMTWASSFSVIIYSALPKIRLAMISSTKCNHNLFPRDSLNCMSLAKKSVGMSPLSTSLASWESSSTFPVKGPDMEWISVSSVKEPQNMCMPFRGTKVKIPRPSPLGAQPKSGQVKYWDLALSRKKGYLIYLDNFYTSLLPFLHLYLQKTLTSGTTQLKRKGFPKSLVTTRLQRGNRQVWITRKCWLWSEGIKEMYTSCPPSTMAPQWKFPEDTVPSESLDASMIIMGSWGGGFQQLNVTALFVNKKVLLL